MLLKDARGVMPQEDQSGTKARTIDFRYAPPSRWTAICRPDDPHKTLVREEGALLYNFHTLRADPQYYEFDRVVEVGLQTLTRPVEVTQRTEDARTPIVITIIRYPHATLELATAGHQDELGRRTDVVRWSITAAEDADPFPAGLRIDLYQRRRVFIGLTHVPAPTKRVYAADLDRAPKRGNPLFLADAASLTIGRDLEVEGTLALASEPHMLEAVHASGFRPASAFNTRFELLGPGERIKGVLFLPLDHQDDSRFTPEGAEVAFEAERAFWRGHDLQPLALEVPDASVMEMLLSCARNIEQAREIKDGLPEFQVGAAVYRGLWMVDGHFLLEGPSTWATRRRRSRGSGRWSGA